MKIQVIDKSKQSNIKYPILMQHIKHSDIIVHFTSPCSGTVITHPAYGFGYSASWEDMTQWVPFVGEIILSNK